jgi:hypothetical protein
MLQQHFSSPEDAVLSSFPPGAVRVVASRTSGYDAYVLVDTRPDGPPYLYGVEVTRDGEGWIEGGSGNSAGWRLREFGADVGTLVVWEEAPPGADRVRVEFEGDVHEEPIESGAYLSAGGGYPILTQAGRALCLFASTAVGSMRMRLRPDESCSQQSLLFYALRAHC